MIVAPVPKGQCQSATCHEKATVVAVYDGREVRFCEPHYQIIAGKRNITAKRPYIEEETMSAPSATVPCTMAPHCTRPGTKIFVTENGPLVVCEEHIHHFRKYGVIGQNDIGQVVNGSPNKENKENNEVRQPHAITTAPKPNLTETPEQRKQRERQADADRQRLANERDRKQQERQEREAREREEAQARQKREAEERRQQQAAQSAPPSAPVPPPPPTPKPITDEERKALQDTLRQRQAEEEEKARIAGLAAVAREEEDPEEEGEEEEEEEEEEGVEIKDEEEEEEYQSICKALNHELTDGQYKTVRYILDYHPTINQYDRLAFAVQTLGGLSILPLLRTTAEAFAVIHADVANAQRHLDAAKERLNAAITEFEAGRFDAARYARDGKPANGKKKGGPGRPPGSKNKKD